MTTISVPITSAQEKFLREIVKSGRVANKAHAMRRGLDLLAEQEAIAAVLEGERDIREGRVYRGDLDELAKKYGA